VPDLPADLAARVDDLMRLVVALRPDDPDWDNVCCGGWTIAEQKVARAIESLAGDLAAARAERDRLAAAAARASHTLSNAAWDLSGSHVGPVQIKDAIAAIARADDAICAPPGAARAAPVTREHLRRVGDLRPGTAFAFRGEHCREQDYAIRGLVIGRGTRGGVEVEVRENHHNAPRRLEWSGAIYVLPL
jgi:hypothetical protein